MTAINQASMSAEINAFLVSGSDITAAQLRQVLQDMTTCIFESGITGFGPPVNLVGMGPAIAGQLTTALQSDCTLAINAAIQPLWTGVHTFGNTTQASSALTGAVIVSGGVGIAQQLYTGGSIYSGNTIYVGSAQAPVEVAQRASGTVSGTVSSTVLSFTIPTGQTVTGLIATTTTAFGASGGVTLTAGSTSSDKTSFVGGTVTISGLGMQQVTFNGNATAQLAAINPGNNNGPNFFVQLTQAGTPSAIGTVAIVLKYLTL